MKKFLTLALALVLVIGCVANASALTIGFSQVGQESDWRTANTDSLRGMAVTEGWDMIYDDAQQKQENQIKALRNFITQGVDYILFTGVVNTGWEEVLTEVNEAEIPLILLDRIPDCADVIDYEAAFGGDFIEEGYRMVKWAGEYMKTIGMETAKVAILEGTTGASAQVDRTTGNLKGLEEYPNMELVAQQSGNFTRAEGQAVMESFLKAHEDIDVLLAENDDMALGAIDAIKAAGKVPGKDIIIVGCDSVKAAFEAIVAGEMNATIECNPLYADAVAALIKKLEAGEPGSRELLHPEEGAFCIDGGIEYAEGKFSVKAADVIADRKY